MPDPIPETAHGSITVALASALVVGVVGLAACVRDAPLPALQVRDVTFSQIDWAGRRGDGVRDGLFRPGSARVGGGRDRSTDPLHAERLAGPGRTALGAPGDGDEEPAAGDGPGAPEGPEEGGGTADRAGAPREIRPVQEGTRKCMPGAFARSLDWLNRVHELGLPDEPQAIYDSLIAAGVSRRGEGGNTGWIGIKARWAREATGGRVVTKVCDGAGILDPIDQVDEETPADIGFIPWLRRELESGEDVELAYQERSRMGGRQYTHIITVVELYERSGRWWIRSGTTRTRARPGATGRSSGPSSSSGATPRTSTGSGRRIRFAVSESVETQ